MIVTACINDTCYEIDLRVDPHSEGHFIATLGGRELRLEMLERKPGSLTLAVNDKIGFFEFHHDKGRLNEVVHNNRTYKSWVKDQQQEQLETLLEEFGASMGAGGGETKMSAQMPG